MSLMYIAFVDTNSPKRLKSQKCFVVSPAWLETQNKRKYVESLQSQQRDNRDTVSKKIHVFSQKIENKSLGIVGGVHVLLLTSGAMSSLKSKIAFALIAQHYCKV